MELVSIIVPVYNTEKFLEKAINSILSQTYGHWELLLIDDGSTDGSSIICKDYSQKHNNIHYHYKKNGGQASARNLGIKLSSGDYISFLDSDDFWAETKLSDQIQELKESSAEFLYGLGYYYYPDEDKSEPYSWYTGKRTGDEFFKILYDHSIVNTNSVLIKKSVLDETGLFDESDLLRGTEDLDLWLRVSKNVDFVFGSKKRNVYYTMHPGGIHFQTARMFIGKSVIYAKYENDPTILKKTKKRKYRHIYRELLRALYNEGRTNEMKKYFDELKHYDGWGFGTLNQRIIWPLTSFRIFNWLSNKVILRIAYRLENLTY